MTDYQCGDIVICNNLIGKDIAGYGIVVTGSKSFGSLMVYQFITINDHSHSCVSRNGGAFIKMVRDNNNFNIFKNPSKAIFIDVETFFEIDNIEMKSHTIENDSETITKLSTVTKNDILIPNGFIIMHNHGFKHEIVGCKNSTIITVADPNSTIYEYNMKNIFNEFSDDVIVSMISKLWPLAVGYKKRSVICKIALKNSLKMRDEERE